MFLRTAKKSPRKTKQEESKKKAVARRRPLLSKPVDDVYLTWLYERPSYEVQEAVAMLKKFQELDFTYPKQYVYINVTLDMALQKKVSWKGIPSLMCFCCGKAGLAAEWVQPLPFSAASCSSSHCQNNLCLCKWFVPSHLCSYGPLTAG